MAKETTNNIQLNVRTTQEFTINNDPNKKVNLNVGDIGIISRIGDIIPKINDLEKSYIELIVKEDDLDNEDALISFGKQIDDIDTQLRECVDHIFNTNVSSIVLPKEEGLMINTNEGEYNFAIIIMGLLNLYEDTIKSETDQLVANMKKRTEKYVNRDHKRKGQK